MNIEYVGRHFHLDDEIKQYTGTQVEKFLKFVEEPVEIRVTLGVEKHKDNAHHVHRAEVHVAHRFGVIQGEEETTEMHDSIHQAVAKVEKQARRSRKKFIDQRRRRDREVQQDHRWPVEVLDRASMSGKEGPRIVKSSHLPIETMSLADAALGLEDSKNDFVVYRDARMDRVQILYKRRDSDYGLIVPEL